MKKIVFYIFTALLAVGCSGLFDESERTSSNDSGIQVIGRITAFDEVNIGTKGSKSNIESRIYNMAMFILDGDAPTHKILTRQFENSSKPLFTIDREDLAGSATNLSGAKIVIIANVTDAERTYLMDKDAVRNLANINACDFSVTGIDIPSSGIPMRGDLDQDLDPNNTALSGEVLEIPLKCLYAKIVFNISVDPNQSIAGTDQSFELTSWQVYNVPNQVRLGSPAPADETQFANGTTLQIASSTQTNKGGNVIYESAQDGDYMTFTFYMPEHKINGDEVDYPWDEADNDQYADYRQYLKPTLVQDNTSPVHPCPTDKKATYVEIKGRYTDHNNRSREVTYTIYLGSNNYDNFHILRNHQYNNYIVIKGINNSVTANGSWVTYDHRVEVKQIEFSFGLERETLLDSHWEIRPIRIDFNREEDTDAVVEVIVPKTVDWISIESPSESRITGNDTKGLYCDADETPTAYGKRRYYTTNLNSTLNSDATNPGLTVDGDNKKIVIHRNNKTGHTTAQIDGHDAHTVWAYIDENVTDSNPYRYATVTCKYYETEAKYNNGLPDVSEDYIFRQNGLHHISYGGHNYYIEYYEEYLYNYDTKEQYGNTTDGMEWGLDGVQLSTLYGAVAMGDITINAQGLIGGGVETKVRDQWNTTVANQLKGSKKYDFYLPSDVSSSSSMKTQDHGGLAFTKQIVDAANINIKNLTTKDSPQSAIEYCLNKNKRDDDTGALSLNNIKWYMPAIDEIEDITCGGYGDFDVFQDKLYWSSQPSFKKYDVSFTGTYKSRYNTSSGSASATGSYYEDNTLRARATKTKMNGSNRTNVTSATNTSGSEYIWGTMAFTHSLTVEVKVGWFEITYEVVSGSESFNSNPPADNPGTDATYDEGNCPRKGQKNRVRVVYKKD